MHSAKRTIAIVIPFVTETREALRMRAIPEDNLAYPVLVTLKSGVSGSGFYFNAATKMYLVTARHVIMDDQQRLRSSEAELMSYSKDPNEPITNLLSINLSMLQQAEHLRAHQTRDVVAIAIAGITLTPEGKSLDPLPGVDVVRYAPLGIVGVGRDAVKRYADVLVANDVVVFGYPTSIGLKATPQLDLSRPLLRKGIIAGLNDYLQSIILDCPVYPGNSGGPVAELEPVGLSHRVRIIGVVSEFVPYSESWVNTTHRSTNTTIANSGYSVAVPMDFVVDLLCD
jgi:hypothetical protein